jgi:hypothetical protein
MIAGFNGCLPPDGLPRNLMGDFKNNLMLRMPGNESINDECVTNEFIRNFKGD